ncbi:hypothetical protein AWB64_02110 [Caballeronia sordidicola]|uniref:Uncharacterized protein n=1 Tax=Caballeronia sordidicola TaxID=196367 RepID=A0A158G1F2_CABSO|nr:hypothetical protein [Caballeronia sordidicola]SAL25906.1 hypothetical protein AWB64_02110 [Caballeronia sordidicola]
MYDLIDEELTHIETIVRRWRPEIEASSILPPAYWREKLYTLISANHLSRAQFQRADAALALLNCYCQQSASANDASTEANTDPAHRQA